MANQKTDGIDYPVRINRYLALKGIAARREADVLIKAGKVKINGRKARLGDQVHAGDDVSAVARSAKELLYIAYNKPKEIVTHTPQEGERSIADEVRSKFKMVRPGSPQGKLFPLGRLDKNSEGLIILTNDGRVTDRLLNPDYGHEKEYLVKVNKPLNGDFVRRIQKGVYIEGYRTKEAILSPEGPKTFRLILTEGKKHQIRRMCTALGYEVVSLKRVRIMNIKLGFLRAGDSREIAGRELETFLENMGL